MNFDIKAEQVAPGIWVIALTGEVDLYTAPEFKQQLLDAIGQGATYGVLVGGVKRLRPDGGQLTIVCTDRNITKIFEITGLNRVFPIHASRAEALESAGVTEAQRS